MHIVELFLIAVGLSMDAFAVSICTGLTMQKVTLRKALIVGIYFGVFQAGMPVIGYFAATLFADQIIAYDHWIAFGLLCFLGGRMIYESFKKEEAPNAERELTPKVMVPFALATSIDALAVGVSFAFLKVDILPAVALIGVTTLAISMVGVRIGKLVGSRFKARAEIAGGVILVLIGSRILLDHLGIL